MAKPKSVTPVITLTQSLVCLAFMIFVSPFLILAPFSTGAVFFLLHPIRRISGRNVCVVWVRFGLSFAKQLHFWFTFLYTDEKADPVQSLQMLAVTPSSEKQAKILLVDDDAELCELLREYLEPEGLSLTTVHRAGEGIQQALSGRFALVVLDIMLPELNGLEVLKRIRAKSQLPILMLTARGEEVDRIVGLEVGADDYLAKPCNPRELLARIRAILRRTYPESQSGIPARPERLRLQDVELDAASRSVSRNGETVELTQVEFDLLGLLLRNAGRVVPREKLVEQVLDRPYSPYDRSIDVHVSNLRRKLGPHRTGEERIKSVRGVGYLYSYQEGRE